MRMRVPPPAKEIHAAQQRHVRDTADADGRDDGEQNHGKDRAQTNLRHVRQSFHVDPGPSRMSRTPLLQPPRDDGTS